MRVPADEPDVTFRQRQRPGEQLDDRLVGAATLGSGTDADLPRVAVTADDPGRAEPGMTRTRSFVPSTAPV